MTKTVEQELQALQKEYEMLLGISLALVRFDIQTKKARYSRKQGIALLKEIMANARNIEGQNEVTNTEK